MKTLLMIICVVALAGCKTKAAMSEYYPPTTEFHTVSEDGSIRGAVKGESTSAGVKFSDNKSFTLSILNGVGF